MKTTLILTIALLFGLTINANANSITNDQNYFVLEIRPDAVDTVGKLVSGLNPTDLNIYVQPNTLAGEYAKYTYYENGQAVYTENISLSKKIVRKIGKHLKNPRSGEQLLEVCGTQARQILNVHRYGSRGCTSCDLTEVTSRLDLIESGINGLRVDIAGLQDDHDVINANLGTMNGKLDTSLNNDLVLNEKLDRIIKQGRTANTIAAIDLGVDVADGVLGAIQRNKILKNQRSQKTTTLTTTIIQILGGNGTTTTPGEGHNGNGFIGNRTTNRRSSRATRGSSLLSVSQNQFNWAN